MKEKTKEQVNACNRLFEDFYQSRGMRIPEAIDLASPIFAAGFNRGVAWQKSNCKCGENYDSTNT